MNNTCVSCGEIIPEGIQVCPKCQAKRNTYNYPPSPCDSCNADHKNTCKCQLWKDWFSDRWNEVRRMFGKE